MTASITDFSQFVDLRRMVGQGDTGALREVAGQFEALFIQTLLKNMREASLGEGMFDDAPSMRSSVAGPAASRLRGVFGQVDMLVQIGDAVIDHKR